MATIRKSITFTEQQDNWVKLQVEEGYYTNDSEYIRDLIRKDQASKQKIYELKLAIQEGIDSGVSNKSIPDIMNEVEERLRSNGKL